jgi:hypothetical protein
LRTEIRCIASGCGQIPPNKNICFFKKERYAFIVMGSVSGWRGAAVADLANLHAAQTSQKSGTTSGSAGSSVTTPPSAETGQTPKLGFGARVRVNMLYQQAARQHGTVASFFLTLFQPKKMDDSKLDNLKEAAHDMTAQQKMSGPLVAMYSSGKLGSKGFLSILKSTLNRNEATTPGSHMPVDHTSAAARTLSKIERSGVKLPMPGTAR